MQEEHWIPSEHEATAPDVVLPFSPAAAAISMSCRNGRQCCVQDNWITEARGKHTNFQESCGAPCTSAELVPQRPAIWRQPVRALSVQHWKLTCRSLGWAWLRVRRTWKRLGPPPTAC